MTQPTPYNRQYNFTDYQSSNPSDPLPGSQVDAEYNAIKLTLSQTLANLALIQRDDGKLANQSVGKDTLDASALALMSLSGFTPKGAWAGATAYAVGDLVDFNYATYVATAAHTSNITFATDLAANRWVLLANAALVNSSASVNTFIGNGTTKVFTLSYSYSAANQAQVFVNGILKLPTTDYTISGTTLTFVDAPPAPGTAGVSNIVVWGIDLATVAAKDAALAARDNAQTYASQASTSKDAAAASATSAATSATNSGNYSVAASNSQTAAAASATAAAASQTAAASSATAAAASQSAAATSATNAASSATAAATSATASQTAKTAAETARDAAAASQSAAATSATNAASSASAASTSASNAATSATNAASSATAAAASQSAAATSATSAATSATLSQDWAAKTTGTVSGGEYSAKYWAQQASSIVTSGVIDDTTTSTIKAWSSSKTSSEISASAATRLPLAGGTMTGAITFAAGQTWPTFNQSTTGNAATATALQTARTINGVSFDGTGNITVADATKLPLAGGTMTGAITFAGGQTFPGTASTGKAIAMAIVFGG